MQRRGVETLAVLGLFVLLTVVATWPQALYLSSHAPPHQDVFFNMWRLRWFAHALITPSAHLFDANIFYPELRTLALSDAMIVEGIVAAPRVWAGVKPLLMQNLLLLGAMAASGAAMLRSRATSPAAAAPASSRASCSPLRRIASSTSATWSAVDQRGCHWHSGAAPHLRYRSWRQGLATGACFAAASVQHLLRHLPRDVDRARRGSADRSRSKVPCGHSCLLAAGGVLALVIGGAYARPYLLTRNRVGERPDRGSGHVQRPAVELSGGHADELALRTALEPGGGPERRLFPGAIPVMLAIVGLLQPPSRRVVAHLLLLVAAFEASLGFYGLSYPFLYTRVRPSRAPRGGATRGLRAHVPGGARGIWVSVARRAAGAGDALRHGAGVGARAAGGVPRAL
jgi:hypothetical protein